MQVLLYAAVTLVVLLLIALYVLFLFSKQLFSTVRAIMPEPPEEPDAKRYVIVGAYDVPVDSPEMTMLQAETSGCAFVPKISGTHLMVRESATGSTMRELSKVHPLAQITIVTDEGVV